MARPAGGNLSTELFTTAVGRFHGNDLAEAERCCREQLDIEPNHGPCLDLLGTILRLGSNASDALEFARRAVRADPAVPLFAYNLGDCYRALRRHEEALRAYQQSLSIREMPQTFGALGQSLEALRRYDEAIAAYEQSVKLGPKNIHAHLRLLRFLYRLGRFQKCVDAGVVAISVEAQEAEIHLLIGLAQLQLRNFPDAAAALREAARLKATAASLSALAAALNEMMLFPQAISAARAALAMTPAASSGDPPEVVESHKQLGIALYRIGKLSDAAVHLRQVLAVRPADLDCLTKLSNLELSRLRHAEAIRLLTDACATCDDAPAIASKRVMAMNYLHDADEREIFAAHVKFGERLAARTAGKPAGYTKRKRTSDRLRIGYVSPDLCEHAVASFADALLRPVAGIDEEVVVFSDCPRPDAVTRRLQSHGNTWHDTRKLNHAELAALVERERIDILVDLAGHTADNRLEMFALRPAPVQMTYLGYPSTTGLPREIMQYRITDEVCDPIGESDALHTEALLRMPETFLCYRAPSDAPAVAEPPSLRNGYVTFGCFSNIAKLSWETLGEWAQLLREVPRSRLMLKNHSLMDEPLCDVIRRFFTEHGIDSSRIELLRGEPAYSDHLARYRDMDIALDTYPYNGTTTICEAMWMGVPAVSRSGRAHRSRVGRSILKAIGLEALVGNSAAAQKTIAAELAGDPGKLAACNRELRSRMAASSLMNGMEFKKHFHAQLSHYTGKPNYLYYHN